jgi:hypothetical protein
MYNEELAAPLGPATRPSWTVTLCAFTSCCVMLLEPGVLTPCPSLELLLPNNNAIGLVEDMHV